MIASAALPFRFVVKRLAVKQPATASINRMTRLP